MTCPASCKTPDCQTSYRDHLLSVSIAATAMPSRAVHRTPGQPDEPAATTEAREQRWAKDLPAFKRCREAGVKASLEGAAKFERGLGG